MPARRSPASRGLAVLAASVASVASVAVAPGQALAAGDSTPPEVALAVTESANPAGQLALGRSVVVNPRQTGSFTLVVQARDAQSGVAQVTFPAMYGLPVWVDRIAPFARTYAWPLSAGAPGRVPVGVRNGAGLVAWSSATVTTDGLAPASGARVTMPAGQTADGATAVGVGIGPGDTGAGMASRTLVRLEGLVDQDCRVVATRTVADVLTSTTVMDRAPQGVGCYTYRLVETDRVGNVRTTDSARRVVPGGTPSALPAAARTAEDTAVPVRLQGTDPDGDVLSYRIESGPTRGTLSGSGADWVYTPHAQTSGADAFTFTVGDATSRSAAAPVTVDVTPVDDAPTAAPVTATSTGAAVPVTLAGSDVDSAALTYAIVGAPAGGTLSGTGAERTYTPRAGFSGTDVFSYTVSDGTSTSAAAAVRVEVTRPLSVRMNHNRGIMSQGAPLSSHPYIDHVTGGTGVTWSSLEPADQSFTGPGWAQLDRLLANPQVDGVRLRVYTGRHAPAFVKQIGGPAVSGSGIDCSGGGIAVFNPYDDAGGCAPRFWTDAVLDQYEQLMREVGRRYGNDPRLSEVVDSACSTVYAEPFYRAHSDAASNARLWNAGLNRASDLHCAERGLEIHASAFPTKPVSLAINPWEIMVGPGVNGVGMVRDWTATHQLAERWRARLGDRLVLQNNGWGENEGCPAGQTPATNVYCYLGAISGPKGYQSETWSRLGDSLGGNSVQGWYNALERAIQQGMCFVESTDNGYRNADPRRLAEYDRRLEANC